MSWFLHQLTKLLCLFLSLFKHSQYKHLNYIQLNISLLWEHQRIKLESTKCEFSSYLILPALSTPHSTHITLKQLSCSLAWRQENEHDEFLNSLQTDDAMIELFLIYQRQKVINVMHPLHLSPLLAPFSNAKVGNSISILT